MAYDKNYPFLLSNGDPPQKLPPTVTPNIKENIENLNLPQ